MPSPMLGERVYNAYRTRGPPWLLLRGGGALLHPTSTKESFWHVAGGNTPRGVLHDSLFVGDRIAHADVLPRTRNQGISVCNLLGNCDGTGAAPRTESRTQAHDSLFVVSDTQSMLAEPVLRHLSYGSGAVLRYSIMVAELGSATSQNWGRSRLRYFSQLGNWEPALHNRLRESG